VNTSPISTTEDIAKLHNEIAQLRNQQFILATVAISVVGFSSWVKANGGDEPGSIETAYTVFTLFLQWIVLVLFIWSMVLRRLIGTISAYLSIKGASDWEGDFRKFSRAAGSIYWSQSAWMMRMYFALVILLCARYIALEWESWSQCCFWFVPVSTVAVLVAIYALNANGRAHDFSVEDAWKKLDQLESAAVNADDV
jgi:uncharacterized membrane protein YhaH (DUF805 family)